MSSSKWLAILLTLCLLLSALPVAMGEEIRIDIANVDVPEANDVDVNLDLNPEALDPDGESLEVELPPLEAVDVPAAEVAPSQIDPADVVAHHRFVVPNGRNYTELSNSTAYLMNGVAIRAGDEETKGSGNCWRWAQAIYKKVWGCNFDSTFAGTASRGHNLVRNLTDEERRLTPENLKYMVSHAVAGATLRVQSCPSTCSGFNTDGCSKHKLHSLIIAEIHEDGLTTMDDQGSVHTRQYTWEGFCNAWQRWEYVKYIKWPNAPALASAQSIDGYGVSKINETYRVRAASKGTGVFSVPGNGKPVVTLKYPATFAADAKTLKKVESYTWVHGKASTGATGWLPLTEAVAASTETIAVTGVTLDQSTLIMAKGGTATLKAAVEPLDATNQAVTWASSDSAVVTVSGGVLTAAAAGTATVTVTTADGEKTAACTVKVANADYSKELTRTGSNGTVTMTVGSKLQLIPTFANAKGWKIKSVSTSKNKYTTVNKSGMVTAKKAGTATITVKCKNGKKATLKVKVVKSGGSSTGGGSTAAVAPTKIYLSKSGTVELKVGSTLQLYTKLEPANATTTLTWASEDAGVASVDSTGKVTALKKGTCRIGVKTANGVYAIVKIRVK